MIFRRVLQHVREQNWTAVGIDFVIVVLGVFIGIQVSNWNAERQREAATQNYYDRLIDDLHTEKRTMNELTAYYEQVKQHGLTTLNRLQFGETEPTEEFFIDAYQASQIRYYTPQRATYNELLGAGIASALPDANLRSMLANYYITLDNAERTHAESTPFRGHLRTYMPYEIQALIRARCEETFQFLDDGTLIVDLASDCVLDSEPALLQRSMEGILAYDAMEAELGRHLSDLDLKLATLAAYHESTENTLAALEEAAR